MPGPLLAAGQHETNRRPVESVKSGQDGPAGVPKDNLHPLFNKDIEEGLGAALADE